MASRVFEKIILPLSKRTKSVTSIHISKSGVATWSTICAPPLALFAFFVTDAVFLGAPGQARIGCLDQVLNHWGSWVVLDCLLFVVFVAFLGSRFSGGAAGGKCSSTKRVDQGNTICRNSRPLPGPRRIEGDNAHTKDVVNGVVIRPPETRQLERWNRAIDAAARQNGAAQAGKLLLDFEAEGNGKACCSPDAVSYNLVIRAFAKQGDLKGAEHWLARMETKCIKATPCSYNTMLDACAKTDNAEACEAWLQKMLDKGVAPSVISYSTAIYARARRGDELMAEAWFARMTAAGIEPDAVCYNSMIHACSVSGNAAGAERWILEMQAQGIEATVTTFSAVIGACAKALDVSRAETWLDAMIVAGVQPNVVTFSTMIDACAKACDPSTAEYWHQRMTECGIEPNAHSYSAIINACAKAGDAIKAEQWLGEAERARVADVVLYSSAIDACGKAGDAERAMKVFRRMQTQGVRPHIVAYAALARPFSHRGDWMTVESIAEEMVSCGIVPNDYFIYAQLLSYAIAEPRQPAKAENCFRNALSSGMKVNDHVLGALARAVGRQSCNSLTRELCQGQTMRVRPRRQHWSS